MMSPKFAASAFRFTVDGLLVALGLAALFCLIGAPLAMVAMISIIGLPIALVMAVVPGLFLTLLTARLAHAGLARLGIRSALASALLAVSCLAAIPLLLNSDLEDRANSLVAADLDQLRLPLPVRHVAIRDRDSGGYGVGRSRCGELCQRLLLTGRAERVLVLPVGEIDRNLDPATPAAAFTLSMRGSCPAVDLQSTQGSFVVQGEPRRVDVAERMRLSIASGRCLEEQAGRLGDADSVLSAARVAKGVTDYGAGLDPWADTVRADRLTVHLREGESFREIYRRTSVVYAPLAPILVPTYVFGYGLEIRPGWLRVTRRLNQPSPPGDGPGLGGLLQDRLQIDIALPAEEPVATLRETLAAGLAQPGAFPAAAKPVVSDFFRRIVMTRHVDPEDAALALELLSDRQVPVNQLAWGLARYDTRPQIQGPLAELLFQRLRAVPVGDKLAPAAREEANAIGTAIATLTADAVRPFRGDLEWLAAQPVLRVPAYSALKQLSVFGGESVPVLIRLIDDANALGGPRAGETWQHPYLAGLIGLCLAGPSADAALAPLLERLDRGELLRNGSYWELTVQTLLRLGAPPEAIWMRSQSADPKERKRFDHIVVRARKLPTCTY